MHKKISLLLLNTANLGFVAVPEIDALILVLILFLLDSLENAILYNDKIILY